MPEQGSRVMGLGYTGRRRDVIAASLVAVGLERKGEGGCSEALEPPPVLVSHTVSLPIMVLAISLMPAGP